MSRQPPNTVAIEVLGNEYQIVCPPDQEKSLREAAQYLNEQMRQIRQKGKIIGVERIAVMAALNITHQLLALKDNPVEEVDRTQELKRLNSKIDYSLNQLKQLKI